MGLEGFRDKDLQISRAVSPTPALTGVPRLSEPDLEGTLNIIAPNLGFKLTDVQRG